MVLYKIFPVPSTIRSSQKAAMKLFGAAGSGIATSDPEIFAASEENKTRPFELT